MSQLYATTSARQLAAALLLFGPSAPLPAEWLADVNAGALYDSTVNRAFKDADIGADGALIFSAGGAYWALSGDDGVTLTADARSEVRRAPTAGGRRRY